MITPVLEDAEASNSIPISPRGARQAQDIELIVVSETRSPGGLSYPPGVVMGYFPEKNGPLILKTHTEWKAPKAPGLEQDQYGKTTRPSNAEDHTRANTVLEKLDRLEKENRVLRSENAILKDQYQHSYEKHAYYKQLANELWEQNKQDTGRILSMEYRDRLARAQLDEYAKRGKKEKRNRADTADVGLGEEQNIQHEEKASPGT